MWRLCYVAEVPKHSPAKEAFSSKYCPASFPGDGVAWSLHLPCAGGRSKKVKSLPVIWNNYKLTFSCFILPRITVVMSNIETQNGAVAQGIPVLVIILEKYRRKSRNLCSMHCMPLDAQSWYIHVPCRSGTEGAGPVTFHRHMCQRFSKSVLGTAALWLFSEYKKAPVNVALS